MKLYVRIPRYGRLPFLGGNGPIMNPIFLEEKMVESMKRVIGEESVEVLGELAEDGTLKLYKDGKVETTPKTIEQPVVEPVVEEVPVIEEVAEPVVEEPVQEEVVEEVPVIEEVAEPVVEEPVQEPVVEEVPVIEEVAEPVVEEVVVEEPVVEEVQEEVEEEPTFNSKKKRR